MGITAVNTSPVLWLCALVYAATAQSKNVPWSCVDMRCLQPTDPCPSECRGNASCQLLNNVPYCACKSGYYGNPFTGCLEQEPQKNCDSSPSHSGRKVYRVERFTKVNFFAALVHCQYHGGKLASIASKEDNDMVKEEIRRTRIRNDRFWTSGTMLPRGHWVWMSSASPLPDFADWAAGQPNDPKDEQCLQFNEKNGTGYSWNDKNCWEEVYPICEYFE